MIVKKHILPVIIFSQFCCTSLWFAGNGIIGDLISAYNLPTESLSNLTSAVQLGFIVGTLTFAFLTISDRYSPSNVFLLSALVGGLFNLEMMFSINTLTSLLVFRFLTGFALAGIYPVGMKIAADYYQKGLGTSLGYLVAALVLGTAFPHLLKSFPDLFYWKTIVISTSLLASFGGLLIYLLVPNGPYRTKVQGFDLSAIFNVFQHVGFRKAAFGYFGHMWELYTFWAFLPVILISFAPSYSPALFSFLIISSGALACVVGGYLSQKSGEKTLAQFFLTASTCCCVVSPFIFLYGAQEVVILFLFIWGIVVIADSPLFSTLVAQNAPHESKGTALTIVNCLGFALTILSIQCLTFTSTFLPHPYLFVSLAIGPLLGLIGLFQKNNV